MPGTYTADIEKPANVVKQHPFHLGTQHNITESFVLDWLRNDPTIVSVALRLDRKLVRFYDWRDVNEHDE